jgi:threonine/homoserine/homoserine lactone efflux protein
VSYLFLGLTLGFGAGISPGPLMGLVISASLRRGLDGGLRVAVAPLITDLPIILATLLVLDHMSPGVLRALTVVGGLVVTYIGTEIIRSAQNARPEAQADPVRTNELWQGVIVNVLNPNPYIFWITVGGPTLMAGWRESSAYPLAFLAGFYTLLVGSKIVIAWLIGNQTHNLSLVWYRRVLSLSGLLMLGLGVLILTGLHT